MANYDPNKIEKEILAFWSKNKIYEKWKKKLLKGKPYYFLQGPPFTSGKLHIGHAWNNALKDIILRYKRMKGFDVWDRAGYDMHGLPVENQVQKELGLKYKEDIEKYGVAKFIKACERYSIKQAKKMDQDLLRLGIWMDYENAYYPINKEFIEGEWFLIKKAHDKKRLYKGKKIMHWCSSCETALAKHELEYKNVVDESIFLKLNLENKKKEYLIVWTTTPWTIPFNLAVMVNPDLDYVKAKVEGETWIVAKALVGALIGSVVNKSFEVVDEFKGEVLEGLKYEAPFKNELKKQYSAIESKHLHTVLLSKEYVDTSAGSGLVHCAPGCGPEDYEVGEAHGLPAFNNLTHRGMFFDMGKLTGLIAKQDDEKFIELLRNKGCLIETTKVEHEYAHCWRCNNPVVFRATVQWFMKVEDLVEEMLDQNKSVNWIPKFGKTAFNSWVESLKDNSITRQRYWGTPVPIWECSNSKCDKIIVISSADELEKKSGKKLKDLHKPWIDDIKIKCNCGSETERVPDVLDVWIDSGTASWNCLYYPAEKEHFKKFFPPDLILEATEQVRLWFSMLLICSLIALKKPAYKNVYMHGMILDYQGLKMSKSLGNIISPYEVIDKHGSDVLRYYMCENTAGETFSFNWENIKVKQRNITVLYNLSNLLIQMSEELKVNPSKLKLSDKSVSIEESFILSVLNSKIKTLTHLFDQYRINEAITEVENLFLELSRSYVKFVRDKSSVGSVQERKTVVGVLFEVLFSTLKMFSTIAPFVSEKIYQNLKSEFKLKEDSIFFHDWPKYNSKKINKKLESDMDIVKNLMQAILHSREKAKLGVRWPLKEALITTKNSKTKSAIRSLNNLIMNQVNIKSVKLIDKAKERAWVIFTDFKTGRVYIDTQRTPVLEAEGFARELIRRVQGLRKKGGLKKLDKINLHLVCEESILQLLSEFGSQIKDRVGAKNFVLSADNSKKKFKHQSIEVIKHLKFTINFSKI